MFIQTRETVENTYQKKQALAVRPSKCGRHCRLRRELQHQADDGNEGHLPGALCITDFWGFTMIVSNNKRNLQLLLSS